MFFGRNFVAQILRHQLASPTIAQSNGDRPFGVFLTDNVSV
jgi:hypothetical protein